MNTYKTVKETNSTML